MWFNIKAYILFDDALVANCHHRGYTIFMYSQVKSVYFPHNESFFSVELCCIDDAIVANGYHRGYTIFMYSHVKSVYFPHNERFSSIYYLIIWSTNEASTFALKV